MAKKRPSATIENCEFTNFGTGIQSSGFDLNVKNVSFDNVHQPFDIKGERVSIAGTRIRNDPKTFAQTPASRGAHVGYRRPNGPPLPVYCKNCRTVFNSQNYNVGSPAFYGYDNEEPCLNCNFKHARVSDGLFDLSKDVARALAETELSRDELQALNVVTSELISNAITAKKAEKKLKATVPRFAKYLSAARKYGDKATLYISLLLNVGTLYIAANGNTDDLLEKILEELQSKNFSEHQIHDSYESKVQKRSTKVPKHKPSKREASSSTDTPPLPKPKPKHP